MDQNIGKHRYRHIYIVDPRKSGLTRGNPHIQGLWPSERWEPGNFLSESGNFRRPYLMHQHIFGISIGKTSVNHKHRKHLSRKTFVDPKHRQASASVTFWFSEHRQPSVSVTSVGPKHLDHLYRHIYICVEHYPSNVDRMVYLIDRMTVSYRERTSVVWIAYNQFAYNQFAYNRFSQLKLYFDVGFWIGSVEQLNLCFENWTHVYV